MSTESPTAPAAPKPARSAGEKWFVRILLIVGIGLILFEVRSKYGYQWTLDYLVKINQTEELNFDAAKEQEKGDGKKITVEELEGEDPKLAALASEPFGSAILGALFTPSVGDKIFTKPTTAMGPDGKPLVCLLYTSPSPRD